MATPPDTQATNPRRELAAIMFSDIAGYTAIMGRDEAGAMRALAEHRALLKSLLPRFNGRMLGEIGDGTLTSFHSASEAVSCAREVQAALKDSPGLQLRIGIHLGEVLFTDDNTWGDGVNIASRIHALAPPGAICVSATVYDELRNKPGMTAKNLGQKNLKNVSRPIGVYLLSESGDAVSAPRASIEWNPRSKRRVVLASIGLLLVGAAAVAYLRRERVPGLLSSLTKLAPQTGKATLAVLPFANMSGDKQDEYFSDGISEEIIGDLSKVPGLQVAARTSSFAFKGRNEDVKKIAGLLGVRNLLEGSVRRGADKLRIDVELIDASNGFNLWSERYEKNPADVFQIQSEIAERVAEKLEVKLLANERERVERKPTENLEAYNLYLQGRYYNSQFSENGWTAAIEYFNRAIQKDPNFALAYEGLGEANGWSSSFTMSQREAIPKAKAAFERALAIDDTLGSAHGLMAFMVLYGYDWNWPAAEREFKRALALDPSSAVVHRGYGEFLQSMSRFDEALREKEIARELNPLEVAILTETCQVYRDSRLYKRSAECAQQAIDMAPDQWYGYSAQGSTRILAHDLPGALQSFEKADSLAHIPATKAWRAFLYAQMGRQAEALRILSELNELSTHRYVDPVWFAGIYAALGDFDRGFQWLDKAYAERSFFLVHMNSPTWDSARSDPRFAVLYKKVGLPPAGERVSAPSLPQ